jgi:NTP pyrophosphatase (non-canonical NTP hydrolase)
MSNKIDIDAYVKEVRGICESRGWKKDWSHGGCYVHLEVSEFIEAVRGKGDPIDELGDVLFTVLAVADHYGIDVVNALEKNLDKHHKLLKELT